MALRLNDACCCMLLDTSYAVPSTAVDSQAGPSFEKDTLHPAETCPVTTLEGHHSDVILFHQPPSPYIQTHGEGDRRQIAGDQFRQFCCSPAPLRGSSVTILETASNTGSGGSFYGSERSVRRSMTAGGTTTQSTIPPSVGPRSHHRSSVICLSMP